jgi:hypothetical protein
VSLGEVLHQHPFTDVGPLLLHDRNSYTTTIPTVFLFGALGTGIPTSYAVFANAFDKSGEQSIKTETQAHGSRTRTTGDRKNRCATISVLYVSLQIFDSGRSSRCSSGEQGRCDEADCQSVLEIFKLAQLSTTTVHHSIFLALASRRILKMWLWWKISGVA